MKYKLTNEDIAFICEMRSEGIRWKVLAREFKTTENALQLKVYRALNIGMRK